MSVRAKFKVQRIECTETMKVVMSESDRPRHERVELRTIVLSPVYSSDPAHENHRFWDASPSGEIKLGTVNPHAWEAFVLGGEYYVTFDKAE